MRALGVIHARGGSKRIPRKNVKLLCGHPLIAYVVRAALGSGLDRLIVSTDDDEIADAARRYGADVPFRRPADLAEDVASELVTQHALDWAEKDEGQAYDVVVTIQPTTPFLRSEDIDACLDAVKKGVNSCFTVQLVTQKPQWMFVRNPDGTARSLMGTVIQGDLGVSQLVPESFLPNGGAYATRTSELRKQNTIFAQPTSVAVMSLERSVDLDEPLDWMVAEATAAYYGFTLIGEQSQPVVPAAAKTSETNTQAEKYFREKAVQYEALVRDGIHEVNVARQRYDYVLDVFAKRGKTSSYLDLGCGPGLLLSEMSAKGLPVYGVDFSPEMIGLARQRLEAQKKLAQARLSVGAVEAFDPGAETFDLISSLGVIEYLSPEAMETMFQNVARYLSPEGSFVIESRNRLFNLFSLNAYTTMEVEKQSQTALLEESLILAEAPTQAEAIARLKNYNGSLTLHESYPHTGIDVEVRHQYTPAQLIRALARAGLEVTEISPLHYHGVIPRIKAERPWLHALIANAAQQDLVGNHAAIPFASSYVIKASKLSRAD